MTRLVSLVASDSDGPGF